MPGSNLANSITPGMLIFENKLLSPNDHNYVDMARELLSIIFISIKGRQFTRLLFIIL